METKKDNTSLSRRDFLSGLKKWSKVVIATAALGTVGTKVLAGSWINRRGSWSDGGGGGWYNRHGGGSWANTSRGGWANRRGGLGWANRY